MTGIQPFISIHQDYRDPTTVKPQPTSFSKLGRTAAYLKSLVDQFTTSALRVSNQTAEKANAFRSKHADPLVQGLSDLANVVGDAVTLPAAFGHNDSKRVLRETIRLGDRTKEYADKEKDIKPITLNDNVDDDYKRKIASTAKSKESNPPQAKKKGKKKKSFYYLDNSSAKRKTRRRD